MVTTKKRIFSRFPIRILVANMFLLAIVITAGIAISLQYNASKRMAVNHMLSSMNLLSDRMSDSVYSLDSDAKQTVNLLAELMNSDLSSTSIERKSSLFAQFLQKRPQLYSLYIGDKQENFFQLINLDSAKDTRQRMGAQADDRWAAVDISGSGKKRLRSTYYYSSTFRLNHQQTDKSNFSPTERPWFAASEQNNIYTTPPYLFQHLQVSGQTYSKRVRNTDQVIGLDILLSSLSDQLTLSSSKLINGQEQAFLFNQNGKIIASNITHNNSDGSATHQYVQDYLGIESKKLIDIANNPNAKQPTLIEKEEARRYYAFITAIGNDILNQQYIAVTLPKDVLFQQATKEALHSTLLNALVMIILLPIIWLFSAPIVRPIRQLQLVTEKIKQRQFDKVTMTDSHIKEIWQLSNSFVSMANDIKQHETTQKGFMEALIRLIATAIDDKSAHTGGHCYRVPELGLMLSDALEKTEEGPYKTFKFANDNERLEFRVAAWLHDCGKITIPEHIIDKGSKLECIYNRIHEIRTRFEVLWRDAEIDYLRAIHIEKQDPVKALSTWEERQTRLQEEFAIVAKANVGSELMSEKDREKIKVIGEQEWTRHFSNRLGLSPAEEMVLAKQEALTSNLESEKLDPQAVIETLLTDKPEHIVPRHKEIKFDSSLGIKMTIPEHQYNQGEIYNLTIKRGTLTEEDRFKVKEHMISTITMLDSLPFPPELSRVPHYASTHHERMDGQGYPRKLNAEQLSLPDRILMIADVFEALTASDRPYKKAKPISATIDIMFGMCQNGHLDLQLFRFFLTSGTYLKYAEKFLPESQLDEVDIERYLV